MIDDKYRYIRNLSGCHALLNSIWVETLHSMFVSLTACVKFEVLKSSLYIQHCLLLDDLDGLLFVLIDCRESGVLGELGWLLMKERAAHCAVNLGLLQQKCSVLIETKVRRESFSALCPLVLTSVNVKSIKNWNPCTAPRWHDAPEEEGKERHWKICQKLACFTRVSHSGYINSSVKVRWEKPMSAAESIDPVVNGEWTHSHCAQKPHFNRFIQVFDQ